MVNTIAVIIIYISGAVTGATLMFEYAIRRYNRNAPPFPDNVIAFRNKRKSTRSIRNLLHFVTTYNKKGRDDI